MGNVAALTEAISLTDQILSVLDESDFAAVADLDARRQPLIVKAFSDSIDEIDVIKSRHLQSLNQQVVEKLSVLKESVLQQQKQIRTASKATRAYTSHQSVAR
ncbi:MAG: hypothetical protein OEY09_00100 [Gammaproteobacteria bacterium]|nr:hypothetical protein [Gammaproteobacteria bacterium]